MDKDKFIRHYSKDLEFLVTKIFDSYELSRDYDIPVVTDEFFTPNIWKKLSDKIENVTVITDGCFSDSDRRQISFIPKGYNDGYEKNYNLLKIKVNTKFRSVEHKDFLGSLLGLKIKRELMGDLIVDKNGDFTIGYIPVSKKIIEIVINSLDKIGKISCHVEKIDKINEYIPNYKYNEKVIVVKSLRLDSVVAELTNLSRSRAVEAIETGKVLVDYNEEKNKSKQIDVGDIITIRKFGKYKIFEKKADTKKGKERYIVKKYI